MLALGFALLREPFLLRGYVEAARLLPRMLGKRRELQRRRRARGAPRRPPTGWSRAPDVYAGGHEHRRRRLPSEGTTELFGIDVETAPPAELLRRILGWAERRTAATA